MSFTKSVGVVRDVTTLAADAAHDPLTSHSPQVICGLQDRWRARERWSADFLRQRYGDHEVEIRVYPAGETYEYALETVLLADILKHWKNTDPDPRALRERRYLAEWNFPARCPELLEDFAVPEQFSADWINTLPENLRFGRMWLFFGEPGCFTGLHSDTFSTSAWLAVLHGSKEVRWVSPEVGRHLPSGSSLWDDTTLEMISDRHASDVHHAVLNAGDTLYIPGNWFHEVRNPERNVMLTANFVEPRLVLSFLADFESRLSEPLEALRVARNAHVRSGAGAAELASPCLRSDQLAWVRSRQQSMAEYEAMLRSFSRRDV